jgi:hypothetical protein
MARDKRDPKAQKRKWVAPEVKELRAGGAEFTKGSRIYDGTLEALGS